MMISLCPRLTGYIASNDKTPVTDGHIDLYKAASKAKADLEGRIFVQVKGRSTPKMVNPEKQSIKFSLSVDDLGFFQKNGGGLLFYVPMRNSGHEEEVFYAILNPFKIKRLMGRKSRSQVSASFDCKRLPSDTDEIERIVSLAIKQRSQSFVAGADASIMESAQSLTIHTLGGLDRNRPNEFKLDRDDFALLVTTAEGLEVPLDIDVSFWPEDYLPQQLAMRISCGATGFDNPTRERVSETELLLRCSDGLRIRLVDTGQEMVCKVDLRLSGSVREQLKDVNFFLQMADGTPLSIGEFESTPQVHKFSDLGKLRTTQKALSGMVQLFDYFALSNELLSGLKLTLDEKRDLLRLRDGLVLGKEIGAKGDGAGRWNFPIGGDKIVLLVTAGSLDGFKSISDPFDPDNRARLRMFRTTDEDAVEEIRWATVYETLEIDDFLTTLNLHLDKIVATYDSLEDNGVRYKLAGDAVLKIIAAADRTSGARRDYLLEGGSALAAWLVTKTSNDIVHRINFWQIAVRRGLLTPADHKEIVAARRSDVSGATTLAVEACLAILLREPLTLEQAVADMEEPERGLLRSWPIWHLAGALTQAQNTNRGEK